MRVLVDSSVWIGHLRSRNRDLQQLLDQGHVACHAFVIGELACGHLARRSEVLELLGRLPILETVAHREALSFVEANRLAGTGLGWVDVHLLASARVSSGLVWTTDRALARSAAVLKIGY